MSKLQYLVKILTGLLVLVIVPSIAYAELDVSVEVSNWSGAPCAKEPVTAGIPLPAGAVYDIRELRIVDGNGRTVPAQFRALSRWWYEKNTGVVTEPSLKWVLCDFQADVPAKDRVAFRLRSDGQQNHEGKGILTTQNDDAVSVVTGPLKFVVSKKSFTLFDSVWFDANNDGQFEASEQIIKPNPANGGSITAGDWVEGGCVLGTKHFTSYSPPERVIVEESAPMKVVLRVEGRHYAANNGVKKGLYGYQVFITAYAGKPFVDVQYALTNTYMEGADQRDYQVYSWPFIDYTVNFNLSLGDTEQFSVLGSTEIDGKLDSRVRLFQGDGAYDVVRGSQKIDSGEDAMGAAAISDGSLGLMVAMRDFAPNRDKAITLEKKKLSLELFPSAGEKYWLDPYSRKNHRMRIEFFSGNISKNQLTPFSQRTNAPLRMLASPEWYRDTLAWDGGFALAPGYSRVQISEWTRMHKPSSGGPSEFGYNSGWNLYGFIPDFNSGGDHWNLTSTFATYLLSGNPEDFENAESKTFYYNDMVALHTSYTRWNDLSWYVNADDHRNGIKYYGKPPKDHYNAKVIAFPDFAWHRANLPDEGHMTNFQVLEYYYLTGDPATYDSILDQGIRALAGVYFHAYWSYGFWKASDHPEPINYNEIKGVSYGPRYVARPMYLCLQAYEVTGDDRFLNAGKIFAYCLRNVVRTDPMGFMGRQYPGTQLTDYTTEWINRWNVNHAQAAPESTCMGLFQVAIGIRGLYKYYEETHDEDIRDAVVLASQFLEKIAANDGRHYSGWGYSWADYWSEGARFDSGVFKSSAGETLAGLSYGFLASGRSDLLAVINDARSVHGSSFNDRRMLCYYESLWKAEQLDNAAPGQIRDFLAENLGNGKVRFTWTAPGNSGDSGQSSAYQIKYSREAGIVDFVSRWDATRQSGWPDLTNPLPYPDTSIDWNQKAQEYLKNKEISFWAANNVKGEPVPQPAGQQESFVIQGLAAGTYHFAIRTWDNAFLPNCSEMATATIKVDGDGSVAEVPAPPTKLRVVD